MRGSIVLVAAVLVSCGTAGAAPSSPPSPSSTPAITAPVSTAPSPTAAPTVGAGAPSPSPTSGSPTPIPLPSFADVAAAGNGVVWALVGGDHLFRSVDRGATWQERNLPRVPIIGKISFVDERNGWILSAGSPATGCMGEDFGVYRTTDGAASWRLIHETTFDSGSSAFGGCKSALAFVDTQHGYIAVSGRDVAPKVLRSSDGGATWSLSDRLPDPPGFTFEPSVTTLAGGAVADFGSVLLVSARSEASGDVRRHVYRSTDRGATWSYVGPTPLPSDVVFLTPARWLQMAPSGQSQETMDAGASWHAFASDYAQAAPVAPFIVFGDAMTGYATVRGGMQRTTDGGAHWTSIATPGT